MSVYAIKTLNKSAIDNIEIYVNIDPNSGDYIRLEKTVFNKIPKYEPCISHASDYKGETIDISDVESFVDNLILHKIKWTKVDTTTDIIPIDEEIYKSLKIGFDNSKNKVVVALPTMYSSEDTILVYEEHKLIGELLNCIGNHLRYNGTRNKFVIDNYSKEFAEVDLETLRFKDANGVKIKTKFGTDGKHILRIEETYIGDIVEINKTATTDK